ncbi:hypothetical protein [Aeromicrobium sp. NPDC092404]|uniref:hypothetical protein n=1 Tax=Aeromicrobium sp. NPDC092404 TaxID=3154976 RepID=UPI003439B3F9
MISRRALLGTGAATAAVAAGLGGAALGHRLDDLARTVGIEPHPEPDPADDRLIKRVAADQNALLARIEATAVRHRGLRLDRFVTISTAHAKAVGGATSVPDVARAPADRATAVRALVNAYAKASTDRAADAESAVSPALARVLASMSAGLAQCARAVGDLR